MDLTQEFEWRTDEESQDDTETIEVAEAVKGVVADTGSDTPTTTDSVDGTEDAFATTIPIKALIERVRPGDLVKPTTSSRSQAKPSEVIEVAETEDALRVELRGPGGGEYGILSPKVPSGEVRLWWFNPDTNGDPMSLGIITQLSICAIADG